MNPTIVLIGWRFSIILLDIDKGLLDMMKCANWLKPLNHTMVLIHINSVATRRKLWLWHCLMKWGFAQCTWKQCHCFDLPIWMIWMMCGDVTVFYPPCCWIPRLMLPRCRGPQGDQVRQCKVRSRVPALLTVCVLTQDRYRHPACNLHHHRNHLYAPAIHIPSPDIYFHIYWFIFHHFNLQIWGNQCNNKYVCKH